MRLPRTTALLAVAAAVAALAAAPLSSAPTACTPGAGWGTPRADLANAVVELVNAHRRARGLRPLAASGTLTAAAVWKARHMAEYRYMAHHDPAPPVARSTGDRIAACGYRGGGWGENIAMGFATPAAVMHGWLTSPGHRANIERPAYAAIGVGAARGSNGAVYWAQAFGTERDGAPAPTSQAAAAPKRAPAPKPATRRPQAVSRTPSALFTSQLFDLRRRPHAGRRYTVRVAVVQRSTKAWVRAGRIRCRATVDGRRAWVGVHRFRRGIATCVFRTPRWGHGHRLTGTIRITARGATTARWFSRRIR